MTAMQLTKDSLTPEGWTKVRRLMEREAQDAIDDAMRMLQSGEHPSDEEMWLKVTILPVVWGGGNPSTTKVGPRHMAEPYLDVDPVIDWIMTARAELDPLLMGDRADEYVDPQEHVRASFLALDNAVESYLGRVAER